MFFTYFLKPQKAPKYSSNIWFLYLAPSDILLQYLIPAFLFVSLYAMVAYDSTVDPLIMDLIHYWGLCAPQKIL